MKKKSSVLLLVFPIILISILAYHNYSIFQTWKYERDLSKHGISTKAQVVDKTNFKSTKGGSTWTLNYSYHVDNKTFTSFTKVPEYYFDRTSLDQYIDINYLPSNPRISNIPNNYIISNSLWAILSLDAIIVLVLILGYFKYKD